MITKNDIRKLLQLEVPTQGIIDFSAERLIKDTFVMLCFLENYVGSEGTMEDYTEAVEVYTHALKRRKMKVLNGTKN